MASDQPKAPKSGQRRNHRKLELRALVASLISGRTVIVFLVLCSVGLCLLLITYIIPFFQAQPNSIPTQLLQQIGITLFVTAIISIVAGVWIDTTRSKLEEQVSHFLQNVVTGRLDDIQKDSKRQIVDLQSIVTDELKKIQDNIVRQTDEFINASDSLQAMSRNSISRMYKKREDAIREIKGDLAENDSLSYIRLIGISLNDFVRDSGVFHEIWKTITLYIRNDASPRGEKPVSIQILLIDPISQGAHLRSGGEQRDSTAVVQSRLAKDVDFTVDSLFELEEAANRVAKPARISFEFRLYQLPPMFFLFSTDVASYIQPYYFWRSRDPAIPLPLLRYRGNSEMHKGLNDHFNWIWEKASVTPERYFKQHQSGTDKGLHQSGVINVFDNPDDAGKRIYSLLEDPQTTRLYVQGFSLRSFFDGEGDFYWKIKQRTEQGNIKIKILIINPESDQAIYRSFREYLLENPVSRMTFQQFKEGPYKAAPLYRDTERTVRWMRKIVSSDSNFLFKWYDTAPYCFLFMVDGSVLVEQYHFGKVGPLDGTKILGKDMARFEYAKDIVDLYDVNKPLHAYKLLESHFEFVFDKCAQEIPATFGAISHDEVF